MAGLPDFRLPSHGYQRSSDDNSADGCDQLKNDTRMGTDHLPRSNCLLVVVAHGGSREIKTHYSIGDRSLRPLHHLLMLKWKRIQPGS